MLRHLRIITPVLFGLALVFGGIFIAGHFGLYRISGFDSLLHTLGGIISGWFGLALLQQDITRMQAWKQMLIIIGVALCIGVAWEWTEYASDHIFSSTHWLNYWFSGGDLPDTLGDLVADAAGAFLFTLWALLKERKG